ncbi:hypothetical protein [Alkalihalobacillus sp. LMS39]|uniref:hypothetical protein n=1 Tax=Alkalihalobacillus sp. LMS39 TaxID=2924032 RepID=UPI001FB53CD6|nr:hypothetical protein [Alkalihalobacillus sp. LMS39]UOE94684.1 hypothetical protein MM271_03280 [Alkalihalobacillus sp. LMS39]
MAWYVDILFYTGVALFVAWTIRREIKKLTIEEKKQIKEELKHPLPLLFESLPTIGLVLFVVGQFLNLNWVKTFGLFIAGSSSIIHGAIIAKNDSIKRGILVIAIGIFICALFLYFLY